MIQEKSDIAEFNENYTLDGEVKSASTPEFLKALKGEKNTLVGLSMVYKYETNSGGLVGFKTFKNVDFIRIFIDVETLEIYTAYGQRVGNVDTPWLKKVNSKSIAEEANKMISKTQKKPRLCVWAFSNI